MISEQKENETVARTFMMVMLLGFFPNQQRSELISKQKMEERERLSMPPKWGPVTERVTLEGTDLECKADALLNRVRA